MNNHFLEFVQTRALISLVNDNRVDNNLLVYVCISLIVNNRSKWFILFTTIQMLWKVLVYGFFHLTLVDTFVYLFNLFQKLGARVLFSEVGLVIIQLVVFFCSGFRVPLCRLLCFIASLWLFVFYTDRTHICNFELHQNQSRGYDPVRQV